MSGVTATSVASSYLQINSHLLKRQLGIVSGYVYFKTLKAITADANLIKFSAAPVATYYLPVINITDGTITHATIGADGYFKNKNNLASGKVYIINPVYSIV